VGKKNLRTDSRKKKGKHGFSQPLLVCLRPGTQRPTGGVKKNSSVQRGMGDFPKGNKANVKRKETDRDLCIRNRGLMSD